MGSLNDYGRRWTSAERSKQGGGGFKRRILIQSAIAVALFFLVAGFISADNFIGDGARYLAGEGIAVSSSWVDFGEEPAAPVTADPGTQATPGNTFTPDPNLQPQFTAPASGIVITDLAVAVSGFATQQGILIQGSAEQSVKAAADGEVQYLGESEDGYIVEILHNGGFRSIYQGLSELSVGTGDLLEIGAVIGQTSSGEVTFSLMKDNVEVNPLEYLFQ